MSFWTKVKDFFSHPKAGILKALQKVTDACTLLDGIKGDLPEGKIKDRVASVCLMLDEVANVLKVVL